MCSTVKSQPTQRRLYNILVHIYFSTYKTKGKIPAHSKRKIPTHSKRKSTGITKCRLKKVAKYYCKILQYCKILLQNITANNLRITCLLQFWLIGP